MNISELREKKSKLEEDIKVLISKFQAETGFIISDYIEVTQSLFVDGNMSVIKVKTEIKL